MHRASTTNELRHPKNVLESDYASSFYHKRRYTINETLARNKKNVVSRLDLKTLAQSSVENICEVHNSQLDDLIKEVEDVIDQFDDSCHGTELNTHRNDRSASELFQTAHTNKRNLSFLNPTSSDRVKNELNTLILKINIERIYMMIFCLRECLNSTSNDYEEEISHTNLLLDREKNKIISMLSEIESTQRDELNEDASILILSIEYNFRQLQIQFNKKKDVSTVSNYILHYVEMLEKRRTELNALQHLSEQESAKDQVTSETLERTRQKLEERIKESIYYYERLKSSEEQEKIDLTDRIAKLNNRMSELKSKINVLSHSRVNFVLKETTTASFEEKELLRIAKELKIKKLKMHYEIIVTCFSETIIVLTCMKNYQENEEKLINERIRLLEVRLDYLLGRLTREEYELLDKENRETSLINRYKKRRNAEIEDYLRMQRETNEYICTIVNAQLLFLKNMLAYLGDLLLYRSNRINEYYVRVQYVLKLVDNEIVDLEGYLVGVLNEKSENC